MLNLGTRKQMIKCMRRFLFLFVLLLLFCQNAFCGKDYSTSKTMYVGEAVTLYPKSDCGANYCSSTYINCDSEAFHVEKIAQTNSLVFQNVNGSTTGTYHSFKLTVLKAGMYTVTCRVNYYESNSGYHSKTNTATYTITVKEVPKVVSISIPSSLSLYIGANYSFSPVIYETGASTTLTWSSSNPAVVTVNAKGVLNAVGLGDATISCVAHNGVTATCQVHVDPIWTTGITLDRTSCQLQKNETIKLNATVIPANATLRDITWTSSNESVATVTQDGTVTGLSAGVCDIKAMASHDGRIYATCQITVIKDNRLATNGATICQGAQGGLALQLVNEDEIAGLQFDIVLPTGIDVASKTLFARGENHTISSNKLPDADNTWRFVVLSTSGDNIIGSEGTLANITLQIADNMALGDYQLTISNTVLTKSDGTKLYPTDVQGVIHIIEPTMGDVNNDGDVDIADAIAVVNHILKKEATVFVNTAADMNSDGIIDIGDAIAIVNVILKK